jgi:N-acetylmuramic acid 6-phosphate etherase
MVDMQLTNKKLVDRGTRMIMAETRIEDYEYAKALLLQFGNVRGAVEHYMNQNH